MVIYFYYVVIYILYDDYNLQYICGTYYYDQGVMWYWYKNDVKKNVWIAKSKESYVPDVFYGDVQHIEAEGILS